MEFGPLQLFIPGDGLNTTIQSAVNGAARNPRAGVWINASYGGTDTYTNPNNVPIFDMRNGGSISFGAGTSIANIWTVLQTFTRFAQTGTALVSGNFVLSGWGTGATITSIGGYDGAHRYTITAGTTPSANPTIQLTYSDGTWTNAPIVTVDMIGGTGQRSDIDVTSAATTYTFTYLGIPVATKTYIFSVTVEGLA